MSVAKINDIYPGTSLKKIVRMASRNKKPFRILTFVIILNCFNDCAITIKNVRRFTKMAFTSTVNAISVGNRSAKLRRFGSRRIATKTCPRIVTLNAVGISSKNSF